MTKEVHCHYFQNVPSEVYQDRQKKFPQLFWGGGHGSDKQETESALFKEIATRAVYPQF